MKRREREEREFEGKKKGKKIGGGRECLKGKIYRESGPLFTKDINK